jgi:hypothetical protein
MKTDILIITAILYILNFSCRDSGQDDPNPPIPKDSCIVYEPILDSISKVRVYTVKDSIVDFGYATKVNSISFFNFGAIINNERILIHLFSQVQDGNLSDLVVFYIKNNLPDCYKISSDCNVPKENRYSKSCSVYDTNHGDVLIDSYILDTSRTDNQVEIISIDTVQKIIEGRFACSFIFANDRPKRDPYNLDTMRFFNGYFKGKYEER